VITKSADQSRYIRSADADIVEHLVVQRLKVGHHAAPLQLPSDPPEQNRKDGAIHLIPAFLNGGIYHFARDVD
jgi:hypothetical protein